MLRIYVIVALVDLNQYSKVEVSKGMGSWKVPYKQSRSEEGCLITCSM